MDVGRFYRVKWRLYFAMRWDNEGCSVQFGCSRWGYVLYIPNLDRVP